MRHPLIYGILASLALLGWSNCAVAEKAPLEQSSQFDYLNADAVPARAAATQRKGKCCDVTEWTLTPKDNDAIELTVVAPIPGKAKIKVKHPTVLWLHREGSNVTRAEFLQEAETMAAGGVASILLELPFKKPYLFRSEGNLGDAGVIRQAVIEARRTIDWAATQPQFNIEKLAVVGQRYGAWAATLLAAVDTRVDAVVLMSPPGKPSGWLQVTEQAKAKAFRDAFDKAQWPQYLVAIEPLDPEKWVNYAAPAKLHFQFASSDAWVQTLEQVDLYRAASQPKSRQMFDSDELLNDEAKKDRQVWLKRILTGK